MRCPSGIHLEVVLRKITTPAALSLRPSVSFDSFLCTQSVAISRCDKGYELVLINLNLGFAYLSCFGFSVVHLYNVSQCKAEGTRFVCQPSSLASICNSARYYDHGQGPKSPYQH